MNTSIQPPDPFDAFVSRDPVVLRSVARLRSWSKSLLGLLLTGEAGVGKSFAARLLHLSSGWPGSSFFICTAAEPTVPASLLATPGRSEATVVLDGLEHWSLESQAALVDQMASCAGARIIAISRVSEPRLHREGRLHPLLARQWDDRVIDIPPLRARPDDLVPLVEGMLRRARRSSLALDATTWRALAMHGWAGNVRELRRAVDAALAQAVGDRLEPQHWVLDHLTPPSLEALADQPFMTMRHEIDAWYLRRLLHETNDNLSEAARRSGCSRKVLRERLRRHGLYRTGWTSATPTVVAPSARETSHRRPVAVVATPASETLVARASSAVVAAEERVVPWLVVQRNRGVERPREAA